MNVKKCIVEVPVIPEPSAADLCELQKRREICPDAQLPPPPPPPPPPPTCHALCWERIKNHPVSGETERPKCPKIRKLPGMERCEEIKRKRLSQDKKWTCKAEVPPPPPPPTPDFCKLQKRDEKMKECLLRMKRYLK